MASTRADEDEEQQLEQTPLLQPPKALLFGMRWLPRPSSSVLLYGGICVSLAVQNSAYTLLRRYSTGVLNEEASSASILAMGEVLKCAFCLAMALRDASRVDAKSRLSDVPPPALHAEHERLESATRALPGRLLRSSGPMAVPASIFLAMNLLSFVALKRISASTFTLIQQSKLIATALLSRWLLGREVSAARWRALGTLLCAVCIICQQTHPSLAAADCSAAGAAGAAGAADGDGPGGGRARRAAAYVLGVGAVSAEACLSGLSNVYFEKVLKRDTAVSFWERNVQLSGFSLLIYLPMAAWAHVGDSDAGWGSLLHGWSSITWLVALLGALGGVLVGLVISKVDSIAKNLALSAAIVLTAVLDHLCFAGPMTLPVVAAAAIVILSILNYTAP